MIDLNNEIVADTAMEIIINAGDARNYASEAVKAAREGDYEKAGQRIAAAKESINKAHLIQTEVIQAEARGIKHEPSLLFIHAQDTLMTIMSEVNIFEEMVHMYELFSKGQGHKYE